MEYLRVILYAGAAFYCGYTVKMGYDEYLKSGDKRIILAMVAFSIATVVIGYLSYREYRRVKAEKEDKKE
ncbi:MAG: hypothetical protein ACK5LE_04825 [Alphaproteobacteria bacterium]